MRKSKKFALAASACVTMLAFVIAGTVGVLNVSANGGQSSDVTVTMVDPPNTGLTTFTVLTPGGQPPATLPVEVEADVTPITTPASVTGTVDITPRVDGVDFALNAVPNSAGDLDGSQTTADDVNAGVRSNPTGMPSFWDGTLDLGTIPIADYSAIADGMMAQAVISALARISDADVAHGGRVPVLAYDEHDLSDIVVMALDSSVKVDINGDGKPDALGLNVLPECMLPDCVLVTPGASGNEIFTVWRPLDTFRAAHLTPEIGLILESADGSVFVGVVGPTLQALKDASTIYNVYDTGRLVLSVAGVPTDLLAPGVDPLAEFPADFPDNAPPQNVFALVNIFLSTAAAPTEWHAVEDLPVDPTFGQLFIDIDISGPGVLAALAAASDVYAYSYDTTNMQDSMTGALVDTGDEAGWMEITPTLSITRAHAVPGTGDNTISISLTSASVITGSDTTPRTTTLSGPGGGGGGGSCFIATAAYGTPLADDIYVLRAVRDSYMLNNALGVAFVDMYYRLSPPVADVVANNAVMKAAVRTVLTPVVILGSFVLAMPGLSVVLLLACVALVAARVRRRTSRV